MEGLWIDESSPQDEKVETETNENIEYTARIIVGNTKKQVEEEIDCEIKIDVCKDALEEFLEKGATAEIKKCLKENFEDEVLPDLDAACEEELSTYNYWGIKIGDKQVYPIQVPSTLKKRISIVERLLKKELEPENLSCEQLRSVVDALVDLVQSQTYTIKLYKGQVNSLKKSLESATDELAKCQEKMLELRSKCHDPNSKVLDLIGQTAQTVLSKAIEVKKEEAAATAKKAEIEAELMKAQLARELMKEEPSIDFERAMEMVEKVTDTFLPKILSILEKTKGG